jgi:hypothetical protein
MKQISYLIILAFIASIAFSSCNDTSYANELKQEKILIAEYIKRNNINVLSSFPADKKWGEKDYVLTSSGLYFHLVDSGDIVVGDTVKPTLKANDIIVPRYKEYNLYAVADTLTSNWSTLDYPYPNTFKFGDMTQSCTAFHEAASYMIRNNSRAKLIVKSKIGFQKYWTPATPLAYDLKIKVQK